MLFGLMMKALQRPKTHLNMASIDKLSGDEVIEECLLSVVKIIEKWQDRQAAVLVIKRENHCAHHSPTRHTEPPARCPPGGGQDESQGR